MESNSYTKKLNKIIYSVVALSLLVLLLFTATYAWLSKSMKSSMGTSNDYITIDADAGLEINYGTEDMNQGTININNVVKSDFQFRECSSVNGKDIYFPLSQYNKGKGDKDFVSNALTDDFLYRRATVKDKNVNYISVDLSLKATSSDPDNPIIPIWLSNETKISGDIASAIRIAFIENDHSDKYVVIDNSEQGYGENYKGIYDLNTDGSSFRTLTTTCNSIGNYTPDNTYGNVLFNLVSGVEKKITVNIWLEGTDAQCTYDTLNNIKNPLDVFIKFTTTSEDKVPYYFVDHTLEKWVDDEYEGEESYVYAIDQNGKLQPMTKSDNYDTDYTWSVELAASNKPVQFARYNPELQEGNTLQVWNLWEAGDPGSCTTYNAFAHNTGIWDDNFEGTVINFYDGSSDHQIWDQNEGTEMLVSYTTADGNGNNIDYIHKMSYQWEQKRYQIVIPSDVSDITFSWCEKADTTASYPRAQWDASERGDNTYFTSTDTWGCIGYWSDKILLVDSSNAGNAGLEEGVIWVAYFFDGDTEIGWTAMNATTTGGRYIAGVPEGATQVIFCRYVDGAGYFDWECVYNQTLDLDIGTDNLFKIKGYSDPNAESNNVYSVNDTDWSEVYCYMWNDDGSYNQAWPGVRMSNDNGKIWSYEVNGDWQYLIFNNGSDAQTDDMSYHGKGSYYLNSTSTSCVLGTWYETPNID